MQGCQCTCCMAISPPIAHVGTLRIVVATVLCMLRISSGCGSGVFYCRWGNTSQVQLPLEWRTGMIDLSCRVVGRQSYWMADHHCLWARIHGARTVRTLLGKYTPLNPHHRKALDGNVATNKTARKWEMGADVGWLAKFSCL